MCEGLRLTELHEEASWKTGLSRIYRHSGDILRALRMEEDVRTTNAEICARVAAQEISARSLCHANALALLYGVSDARRFYPAKRRGESPALESFLRRRLDNREHVGADETFPFNHWTHHAAHFLPVEGCHLCREAELVPEKLARGMDIHEALLGGIKILREKD